MRKNIPLTVELRHCHLAPMSLSNATEEYLGVVVMLGIGWAAFMALLFAHINSADSLEKFLTRSDATLAFDGAAGAFGLLITVKLVNYAQALMRIAAELHRDGTMIAGVIIDKWRQEAEDANYVLSYRFNYLGAIWIGEQMGESLPFQALQIGDCVTIRFLAHNPRISRIQPDRAVKATSYLPENIQSRS